MRLYQLFEDVHDDYDYRRKAERILFELINELKTNNFSNFMVSYKTDRIEYEINTNAFYPNLGNENYNIVFVERLVSHIEDDTRGMFTVKGGKHYIYIFVDPFSEKAKPFWKDKTWHSTFIHETIHHFDSFRNPKLLNPPSEIEQTDIQYINSPEEFNAYYQQAMYDVEKQIRLYQRSDRSRYEKFYDKNLSSVDRFVDFVVTQISSKLYSILNPKYQRKLKKRIAQYYDAVKNDISPY